jgi:MSHA biogenesis protein MshN
VPRTQPDDVRADSGPGPEAAEEERRPQRRKSLAMAMPGAPADAGAGHTRLEKHDRPSTPRERAERAHAQAATWLGRGEVGEAERSLREALREDAAYTAARQALVRLLAEQGRGEEARLTMLEGLSAAPQDVALAIAAARLLAQAGDAEGALRALDGAAQPGRTVAEFRGLHAAILQKLGKHAEAAEEYQAALRLAPDSAVWWMGLGLALEAQERPAEAREAFQRAGAGGTLPPDLAAFVNQKLRRLP